MRNKRPNSHSENPVERILGTALCRYISEDCKAYDPEFSALIKSVAPEWFEDTVSLKKARLLDMARSKCARPNSRSNDRIERSLGLSLVSYTNANDHMFDPAFNIEIRSIAPQWFPTIEIRKAKLIELAKSGAKRPFAGVVDVEERRLGMALWRYTSKNNAAYDPIFDAEIRELAPDWFAHRTSGKKATLIEIAVNGGMRPRNSPGDDIERSLCRALENYTYRSSKSYDPAFDAEIRALRPDWFRRKSR